MMNRQALRQKIEKQHYGREKHAQDLSQRIMVGSDVSQLARAEKRRWHLQKVHQETANHLFFSHDDRSALDPPGLTDYL